MTITSILILAGMLAGLVAILHLIGQAYARKSEKIIKDGLGGRNSMTMEAMPIQLPDVRRGFERYQWKLVGDAPQINGAKLYRFVRAASSAPDAYELWKAWQSEKDEKPTVKCDFPLKFKAYEVRDLDDTRVP